MHFHSFWILYSAGRPSHTTPSHDRASLFAKKNTVCLLHIQRQNSCQHHLAVPRPQHLPYCACVHSHFAQHAVMALSTHETQPCPELVEQWVGLLACWADSFFARQHKIALLNHLHRYLDLRIGLHEGSMRIARLLTLCAFAIASANQDQTFTVNSLALFASAFDWSKPTACFPGQASSRSARGLLTAASDPNFRNFAVQHRWHEHSEAALVSLLQACVGPKTTRLLNAVLSCLEDLEFIVTRLQPALPALAALEMHSHKPVDLTSCSQI